jgi:hypothetical protein
MGRIDDDAPVAKPPEATGSEILPVLSTALSFSALQARALSSSVTSLVHPICLALWSILLAV